MHLLPASRGAGFVPVVDSLEWRMPAGTWPPRPRHPTGRALHWEGWKIIPGDVAHEITFAFFRWFSLHYFLRSVGVTPKQAVGRQRDLGWFKISFGECFFENWRIFYPRPHETELVWPFYNNSYCPASVYCLSSEIPITSICEKHLPGHSMHWTCAHRSCPWLQAGQIQTTTRMVHSKKPGVVGKAAPPASRAEPGSCPSARYLLIIRQLMSGHKWSYNPGFLLFRNWNLESLQAERRVGELTQHSGKSARRWRKRPPPAWSHVVRGQSPQTPPQHLPSYQQLLIYSFINPAIKHFPDPWVLQWGLVTPYMRSFAPVLQVAALKCNHCIPESLFLWI